MLNNKQQYQDFLRESFFKFFKNKQHSILSSSGIVPSDSTLLFTNSGMVQFKDIFLDNKKSYVQSATTIQKCVRAGGKHNDLDQVGHTARHMTFFEMMGNFSFGGYFKKECIQMCWDFLTKELKVDQSKLYVTVYYKDDESYDIWKNNIGLDVSRITKVETEDNFWSMGPCGPCGPCSEIYYDLSDKKRDEKFSPIDDEENCMEIWNMVFMSFDRQKDGSLKELSKKCIDTGMGLERMLCVLEKQKDIYKTSIFQNILHEVFKKMKIDTSSIKEDAPLKVLLDHARCSVFLLSEGVVPSNEGRGYVLRRIIRRKIRYVSNISDRVKEMIINVSLEVIKCMGKFYPELEQKKDSIVSFLEDEIDAFLLHLNHANKLLQKEILSLKENKKKALSGEFAFKMHDTFGFPIECTTDVASSFGFGVDLDGFKKLLEEQKKSGRSSWKGSGDEKEKVIWDSIRKKEGKGTVFCGYDLSGIGAKSSLVRHIVQNDKDVKGVGIGDIVWIVFDATFFYPTGGGQVCDTGSLWKKNTKVADVLDVKKFAGDLIFHKVKVLKEISVGDSFVQDVNLERRRKTSIHHTSTHLLHKALRHIIGNHVCQRGSEVGPDGLRFDYNHNNPLTDKEIFLIENFVNDVIDLEQEVVIKEQKTKSAIEDGALALFEEKYADISRTVLIQDINGSKTSFELCGGTHVKNTKDIRVFKIISDSNIGSSIRRIEAKAGRSAVQSFQSVFYGVKSVSSRGISVMPILNEKSSLNVSEKNSITDALDSFRVKTKDFSDKILALKKSILIYLCSKAERQKHKLFDLCIIKDMPKGCCIDMKILSDCVSDILHTIKSQAVYVVLLSLKDDKKCISVFCLDENLTSKIKLAFDSCKMKSIELRGSKKALTCPSCLEKDCESLISKIKTFLN